MKSALFLSAIIKVSLGVIWVGALLCLSMPLVPGSALSFLVFLSYPFIIAKHIRSEEDILAHELNGYEEYMQKVRWRLIPFIW